MPPRQDAAAIRSSEPIKDASCLGVPKPHISDGVYLGVAQAPRKFMGSTPCPQERTLPLFGRIPEPQSKRRKLFGSPQTPYLRWRVFGSYPSPQMFMGSTPCPQDWTLPLFGRIPEPQSKRRKLFGSPQAPYLRWRVFGSCPSPKTFMGSTPCPQIRTLPLFGRMPEPQSKRRKLFGSPQAPYLRWRVFGSCPNPKGVYGEYPMTQDKTLPLFGVPNPI